MKDEHTRMQRLSFAEAIFVPKVKCRSELMKVTLKQIDEGCPFRSYVVKEELHYYISGSIENILMDEYICRMEIGGYKEKYCGMTAGAVNCLLICERGDRAGILVHYDGEAFQFAFYPVITNEIAARRYDAENQLLNLISCSAEVLVEKGNRYVSLSEILANTYSLLCD